MSTVARVSGATRINRIVDKLRQVWIRYPDIDFPSWFSMCGAASGGVSAAAIALRHLTSTATTQHIDDAYPGEWRRSQMSQPRLLLLKNTQG